MRFVPWVESMNAHQTRTDIPGALDAARQEFDLLPNGMNHRLVFLSDFFEDDGTYPFVSDGLPVNPTRARELGASLREEHCFTLHRVSLCLGHLESSDFAPLSVQRKCSSVWPCALRRLDLSLTNDEASSWRRNKITSFRRECELDQ